MGFRVQDLVAGVAVAGLMIPEGVAYAGIAGLAPGRALAAGVAGGLAYAAWGQSRFAIISPTSSSAAILAAALATLPGDAATKGALATAMVALVGFLFASFSLLKLGGLAGFISRPVLRGFAFGLAIAIIVKQLPKLMGVSVSGGSIWHIMQGMAAHLSSISLPSLGLGVVALAALMLLRRVPQIPGALIVLVTGIGLASFFDLRAAGIALAGPIVMEQPTLAVPRASFVLWAQLVQMAAPIALILFAESWGTMRNLALKHGDTIDASRELGALGFANIASAMVQGMPVGAGFSAGSASEAAGAGSRITVISASIAVLVLAVFAGGWIARIPEPVLAAIVIAALTHALSLTPIRRLFRIERDQWIAVAAAVGVLVLGVLNGMLVAVALSIASLLREFSSPTISELGRLPGSHDFVDRAQHKDAERVPGVALYRPNAPLFFANAESVLGVIATRALATDARTVILSLEESSDLDATAIEVIGEFDAALAKGGKRVMLARAHDRARAVLAAAGLAVVHNSTFSVADAVDRALSGD